MIGAVNLTLEFMKGGETTPVGVTWPGVPRVDEHVEYRDAKVFLAGPVRAVLWSEDEEGEVSVIVRIDAR